MFQFKQRQVVGKGSGFAAAQVIPQNGTGGKKFVHFREHGQDEQLAASFEKAHEVLLDAFRHDSRRRDDEGRRKVHKSRGVVDIQKFRGIGAAESGTQKHQVKKLIEFFMPQPEPDVLFVIIAADVFQVDGDF